MWRESATRMKNHCLRLPAAAVLFLLIAASGADPIAAGATLKAGLARTDITPSESLYLGGYALRTGPSDGVFGKIYIRALVFDDGRTRLALVESDILDYPDAVPLRKKVAAETGIPFDNILLGSVHNHSAPVLEGRNGDSRWNAEFGGKMVQTVKAAIKDLEPVRIGGGVGHSRIAINRRKTAPASVSTETFDENYFSQSYGKSKTDKPVEIHQIGGVIRLGANPEGPIDDEVGVLRIDTDSGKPKGVFVSYACHGTSLGGRNGAISPEWMGHMLEYVEKKVPGVTGLYAQGAAGDINPRFVGGLEGYRDNLQKTAELGGEIGREVVRVFNTIQTSEPMSPEIRLVHQDVLCPKNYRELAEDFRQPSVAVPTTAVRIDDFCWVTFPGELFHQIGKRIKSAAPTKYSYLVGYCNGDVGYLPTQQAFAEGGYEPAGSRFDPVSEQVYVEAVSRMMLDLY